MPLLAFSQSKQSDEYYNKGVELYNAGKYKQAIPYFEKSIELDYQEMEEGDNRREYSVHWLAACYLRLGNEEKAAETYPDEYMVPPVDRRLTVESDALSDKVSVAMDEGDYQTAIRYLSRMVQIEKVAEGENHPWVANDYLLLGCCNLYTGNYSEAEKYIKMYVNIYEKNYGMQSLQYARAMNEMSIFYFHKHEYSNAISCCQKACNLYGKLLDKSTLEYTQCLNMLAICYSTINDNDKAVQLQQEHLALMSKIPGVTEDDYITSVGNLALYLQYAGRYGEALKQFNTLLARAEKSYGKKSAQYAVALSDMAYLYNNTGNIHKAVELEQQALTILEKDFNGSEEHVRSLIHFYEYFIEIGGTANAKDYVLKAFDILKKANEEKTSQLYLEVLDYVVTMYFEIGDIQAALKLEDDKLKIFEQKFGKASADYINAISDYAVMRGDMGDYDLAIQTLETNIAKMQKSNIVPEPYVYTNLADFYMSKSEFQKAEKYYRKAMDQFASNKDTVKCWQAASEIAMLKLYLGNWDDAYNFFTDSIMSQGVVDKINEQSKNKDARNLTSIFSIVDNYKRILYQWMRWSSNNAELKKNDFWKTAADQISGIDNMFLEYYETARGKESPDYIGALYQASFDKLYMDDASFAEKNIPTWFDWTRTYIRSNFSTLTTQERFKFQNLYSRKLGEDLLIFPYKTKQSLFVSIAYDGQLFIKGLSLNAELEIQKLIEKSGNRQMKEKYQSVRDNRAILDNLYQIPVFRRTISADSLLKAIERQEKELVSSSKELGDFTKNLSVTWQQVQSKLKDGEIAVEFADFFDDDGSRRYVALVLKKGMSAPEFVKLDYTETDSINYKSTNLYNKIWQPLKKYLDGAKNVYFSPSGKFHTIAIEYLPDESGEIFAKKYNAYRLSSTRELALEKKSNLNKKAAVYGGIIYDFEQSNWADLKNEEYKAYVAEGSAFRDVPIFDNDDLRGGASYLKGTELEAKAITSVLRSGSYQVSENYGIYATEESFNKLSGSGINILHIGTHGFYHEKVDFTPFYSGIFETDRQSKEDLSLSKSGLLLAGANSALDPEKRKQIPEGIEDGILTAKEISRLDFKGLDLVVLSACQTGLGEVTGEGVFGLQRGFKKAGAQTIVMSLWKVSDVATQLLMTEFFKNLTAGQTKRSAFVAAQDAVRQKYPDPKFWAAFIMVDGME